MKAMILAAGYGTRLRPHTEILPKPLFTLAGRTLLEILIEKLAAAGCEAVAVNTHHLRRKIEAFVDGRTFPIPVTLRFEPLILGTGGGIRNLSDFWDERPFMVINGDIYTDIDFRSVYAFHCRHPHPATLVLVDQRDLNSVRVDPQGQICGFGRSGGGSQRPSHRVLTFTGIQVLDPEFLDYVPADGCQSSIDAYRSMLSHRRGISAFIPANVQWCDLGTIDRYRKTAVECCLARAWERAFRDRPQPTRPPERLAGDGSDRRWYRFRRGGASLVMADHGIRRTEAISEIDSFIRIGEHLHAGGVAVPAIHFADSFAGLVFLEDLGDTNLQQAVRQAVDMHSTARLYRRVIDRLVELATKGMESFDTSWCYQGPRYDKPLILARECRYFVEAFLNTYLGRRAAFEDYADEFNLLADKVLENGWIGFMHRDCQSRNIMLRDQSPFFIDYQGGRIGPIQYDLAALLIDPYTRLREALQEDLLSYGMSALEERKPPLDPGRFQCGYRYAALARNLQILGAFGHLSKVRGKAQFGEYIPAAVHTLQAWFSGGGSEEFPNLAALSGAI
jgi:aminoglycoside/choline kinase family phosphotransferase